MAGREQDGLPYRTPGMVGQRPVQTTSNEQDYSTLQIVRDILAKNVEALYKDFNAFGVNKDKDPDERAKILLHEVEVKQGVFDIVNPLLEAVNSAMLAVDQKYKQK